MRLSLTVIMALLIAPAGQAITLRLHPEINMLVLDGHKVSGPLLRGASSLELERGEHQFLFRVEKNTVSDRKNTKKKSLVYQSAPMIVTFTAEAKSIHIRLPTLDSHRQRYYFNNNLDFQVIDERGNEIISKRDRLDITRNSDAEKAMGKYNRNGGIASVPRFASSSSGINIKKQSLITFSFSNSPVSLTFNQYLYINKPAWQHFLFLPDFLNDN